MFGWPHVTVLLVSFGTKHHGNCESLMVRAHLDVAILTSCLAIFASQRTSGALKAVLDMSDQFVDAVISAWKGITRDGAGVHNNFVRKNAILPPRPQDKRTYPEVVSRSMPRALKYFCQRACSQKIRRAPLEKNTDRTSLRSPYRPYLFRAILRFPYRP